MMYALITGDEFTKFEPIAFIYNEGEYEVICQSFDRQKSWYTYLDANKNPPFEKFLTRFSYQDVKTGEVTPAIKSSLDGLRLEFANQHILQLEKKKTEGADL